MSDKLKINRRDFLSGTALSLAAGYGLSPLEILAMESGGLGGGVYPPALTGLRGNHPGSFEVAHALSWSGATWPRPATQTDGDYDLVVVGGGISGLSAAYLYRQRTGPDAKILVLDNHDDFGGHAKRNEFTVDGKPLIGYGGSQSIDTPGSFSPAAAKLLTDVSIDTQRFYDYFDREFFSDRGLGRGIYFSSDVYGEDRVAGDILRGGDPAAVAAAVDTYPISEAARAAMRRLLTEEKDYLAGKSRDEKIALLRQTSYTDFLTKFAGVPDEVALIYRDTYRGWWGVGWDAVSALAAYRTGYPGTRHLGIGKLDEDAVERDEPYIFHFPDGNAGVARALVRKLVPAAVPGTTMEDMVRARVDYGALDDAASNVRIRLNSTAVNAQHTADEKAVDVIYLQGGDVHRVRGRHVVMACYNNIIPHICPEVPEAQKEAIAYAKKVPLVYVTVALRNWQAFAKLGYYNFYIPQPGLMHSFGMDFPVSMGGYDFAQTPDQPTLVHGAYVPTEPGKGLMARDQHVAGRRRIYEMSFEDFERDIVRQMSGALRGGGFDAGRDIAAITVNRWPHGYAYEYNDYSDPAEFNPRNGPHVAGRAQIGRISIANSDASAFAFVNGAIDAADRAVNEQLGS